MLVVPVLVDPVLACPVLADPVFAPPEAVSVELVLAPPVPDDFDAGGAGVEELLPGADEDLVAVGSAAAFDGVAVPVVHGVAAAAPDAVPSFALELAGAEAGDVAVLVAVALADPVLVAVAVDVAVEVSLGSVLPLTVPPLDPLSVALGGLLAGVPLGASDLAGVADVAAEDDRESGPHVVVGWLLWLAEVPPWPVPPAPELYWVPAPLTLGTPLPVLELVIPTAELSSTKAWRSGGTASATPMANTTHAAARAGRSSPYRQSRGCCARSLPDSCPPRAAFKRRTRTARKPPYAAECLVA